METPTTEVSGPTDPAPVPKSVVTARTSQGELQQTRPLLIDSGLIMKVSSEVSSVREMSKDRSSSAWQRFTNTTTTSLLLGFVL